MAEDEAANDETLNDIEDSDIRTGVYEGGFKTWECSVDLASILLDRGPRKDIDELVRCDQVVEVSCHIILILIDNDERGTNVTIPNS
jgi:protein-histidine N-methyltransferase